MAIEAKHVQTDSELDGLMGYIIEEMTKLSSDVMVVFPMNSFVNHPVHPSQIHLARSNLEQFELNFLPLIMLIHRVGYIGPGNFLLDQIEAMERLAIASFHLQGEAL